MGHAAIIPFERAMMVSYRFIIVTIALVWCVSNHSAAICHRMSPMDKSTGSGHFGQLGAKFC